MSSTSEKGHIKNAENFTDLINACITYGPSYNPISAIIQIPTLQTKSTSVIAEFDAVRSAKTTIQNIINQRQEKFGQVPDIATRTVSALEASGAPLALVRDARVHLNKIRGRRAATIPTPAPGEPEPVTISVSQRSFDQLTQHFRSLVELVISFPGYTPNELPLQAASLQNIANELQASNNAESAAQPILSMAIIARNQALYADGTGLCDIAQNVKTYVKSIFGASSPQYKLINKIKFIKRKL